MRVEKDREVIKEGINEETEDHAKDVWWKYNVKIKWVLVFRYRIDIDIGMRIFVARSMSYFLLDAPLGPKWKVTWGAESICWLVFVKLAELIDSSRHPSISPTNQVRPPIGPLTSLDLCEDRPGVHRRRLDNRTLYWVELSQVTRVGYVWSGVAQSVYWLAYGLDCCRTGFNSRREHAVFFPQHVRNSRRGGSFFCSFDSGNSVLGQSGRSLKLTTPIHCWSQKVYSPPTVPHRPLWGHV
jgi:hypothetical protein